MRVLVCDDIERRCAEVVDSIREAGQPNPQVLVGPDLTEELSKLFASIREYMADDATTYKGADRSPFDDADIIILDNNLTHLHVTGARLTAESIAGYIRAFTEASYIVSLNKNPDVDFDLRYLMGDYSTRADLALNTEHLSNPALWTRNQAMAKGGFLPWYWPRLEKIADRRQAQQRFVLEHLDDSVFSTLGFEEEAISSLPAHAIGALSPRADLAKVDQDTIPINELTFRQVFMAENRSLPVEEEREKLNKGEQEGIPGIRETIARIVAADIDHWFRRDILGPQETLVDIPHLLLRMPFLLGTRASDLEEWNKSAVANSTPYGLEQRLYDAHLAERKFVQDTWVPFACFWWHKLKADESLNELFFAAKEGDWADAVFCEDTSAFAAREPTKGVSPVEFPAEFDGSWTHRYVSRIEGVHYAPRSQLAL